MKALRRHVAGELGELGWWDGGGHWWASAARSATSRQRSRRRRAYPDVDVGGFELSRDALEELIEVLASKPASKRGSVRGIKPDRTT